MGFISGEGAVRPSPLLIEMQCQSNSSLPPPLTENFSRQEIDNFPRKQDLTFHANFLFHLLLKQVLLGKKIRKDIYAPNFEKVMGYIASVLSVRLLVR